MNENLKVSFYLKRERKNEKNSEAVYPVVGKIIIDKSIAQFNSKLKAPERLWGVKSGRATGKSQVATELNREINKLNTLIHSHYGEILKRTGKVSALEVKMLFRVLPQRRKRCLRCLKKSCRNFIRGWELTGQKTVIGNMSILKSIYSALSVKNTRSEIFRFPN